MTERNLRYYLNNRNFIKRDRKKKNETENTEHTGLGGDVNEDDEIITPYTYMTKKNRGNGRKWSEKEDLLFYKLLECCGCEFSMMSTIFQNRTRGNLREKYRREYRINKEKIETALKGPRCFDPKKLTEIRDEINKS
jgi:hypothetical protein